MTTEEAILELRGCSQELKQDAQDLRDDEVFFDDPDIACNERKAKAIDKVLSALADATARAERADERAGRFMFALIEIGQTGRTDDGVAHAPYGCKARDYAVETLRRDAGLLWPTLTDSEKRILRGAFRAAGVTDEAFDWAANLDAPATGEGTTDAPPLS